MKQMNSMMVLTKKKTVYVHLGEILEKGELIIKNKSGNMVFKGKIADSFYEVITLNQPNGKYWLQIESDKIKAKKSFQLK